MRTDASIRPVAAATVACLVPLALLDRRMQKTGGPGIIPFELAGPERSEQILRVWGPEGRQAAMASLALDFPFLVSYTLLNARLTQLGERAANRRGIQLPRAAGRAAIAAHVTAGACDAIENTALLVVVAQDGNARMAGVARSAARTKFCSLLLGWLYGAWLLGMAARA